MNASVLCVTIILIWMESVRLQRFHVERDSIQIVHEVERRPNEMVQCHNCRVYVPVNTWKALEIVIDAAIPYVASMILGGTIGLGIIAYYGLMGYI